MEFALCLTAGLRRGSPVLGAPGSPTFRPALESPAVALQPSGLQTSPRAFLGPQLSDGRWWDFSAS